MLLATAVSADDLEDDFDDLEDDLTTTTSAVATLHGTDTVIGGCCWETLLDCDWLLPPPPLVLDFFDNSSADDVTPLVFEVTLLLFDECFDGDEDTLFTLLLFGDVTLLVLEDDVRVGFDDDVTLVVLLNDDVTLVVLVEDDVTLVVFGNDDVTLVVLVNDDVTLVVFGDDVTTGGFVESAVVA